MSAVAAARIPSALTPTLDRPLRVLIAGGPQDIARELTAWLAPRGLKVIEHWPSDKRRAFSRPIPAQVEFVIVLVGHISHDCHDVVVNNCRRTGTRYVRALWNRSHLQRQLAEAGIRLLDLQGGQVAGPQVEGGAPTEAPEQCAYRIAGGERCSRLAAPNDALCRQHREQFEQNRSAMQQGAAVTVPAPRQIATAGAGTPAERSGTMPQTEQKAQPQPLEIVDGRYFKGYAQYIRGHSFDTELDEALVAIVDGSPGITAEDLVRQIAQRTGVPRLPSGLGFKIRNMRPLFKTDTAVLARSLGRMGNALSKKKTALLKDEAKRIAKCKRIEDVGRWISREAATKVLGGVSARLKDARLVSYLDVQTGLSVYPTAEVAAARDRLIAHHGKLPAPGASSPHVGYDEIERTALDFLGRSGPAAFDTIRRICRADPKRVAAVLQALCESGRVRKIAGSRGNSFRYLLPGAPEPLPAVKPKETAPKSKTAAPAATPIANASVVLCACGTANPAGSKFCGSCGKHLDPPKRYCGKCGAEVARGNRFCTACGTVAPDEG